MDVIKGGDLRYAQVDVLPSV